MWLRQFGLVAVYSRPERAFGLGVQPGGPLATSATVQEGPGATALTLGCSAITRSNAAPPASLLRAATMWIWADAPVRALPAPGLARFLGARGPPMRGQWRTAASVVASRAIRTAYLAGTAAAQV